MLSGGQQRTPAFMTVVMELLTKPGDIIMDWAAAEGAACSGGKFCQRFVCGLEKRPNFFETAEAALHEVVQPSSKGVGYSRTGFEALANPDEEEDPVEYVRPKSIAEMAAKIIWPKSTLLTRTPESQ
jgi:hypothetical protein